MLTLIPTRHSGPDCCQVSKGFILSSLQGSVAVHKDFKTYIYSKPFFFGILRYKFNHPNIQAPILWFLCIFWGFNHPLDQKCVWEFGLESQWKLNNEMFSFFRTFVLFWFFWITEHKSVTTTEKEEVAGICVFLPLWWRYLVLKRVVSVIW